VACGGREIIARHADFVDHARVAALGDADSYATRLYDYEHSGRDQIAWGVDWLCRDPADHSLNASRCGLWNAAAARPAPTM
jgi:hypothetical protein